MTPDWNSKKGFYATDSKSLKARALWNRHWLRARPEREIAVVAHADMLRYITDGQSSLKPWANCEVREYTFAVDEEEDKEGSAWLVLVKKVAKEGADEPTSSTL